MTIWVDNWQMQCCGQPFVVGSLVSWTVHDADSKWLTTVLGEAAAARIDGAEEHHGGSTRGETWTTTGTVTSIAAAHCRFAPASAGDSPGLYPVSGSGVLTEVDSADGWVPNREELRFVGYVVRLTIPPI